jgi:hypothetical protein
MNYFFSIQSHNRYLILQGEDLIDASTQLIHQGEVVKVTTGMWTHNITLFLFDHQIVYCKKVRARRICPPCRIHICFFFFVGHSKKEHIRIQGTHLSGHE